MQLSQKRKRKPLINITSLIDVLFLLLIFFMVSSTFLDEPGMELSLPEAESAEAGEKKEFALYISPKGEYRLNNSSVHKDSLQTKLKHILRKLNDETLVVKADAATAHKDVVKAMDSARLAGIKKLVVATDVSPKEQSDK